MSNTEQMLAQHRGLIAILRGISPDEVIAVSDRLLEAGISIIEVPLNSPDPFDSIAMLRKHLGDQAIVGAGTVLTIDQVGKLADIGAQIIVSPNMNPAVIGASKSNGMISAPGVFSPTEAFAALDAGADILKYFPADVLGPKGIAAQRAVLPKETNVAAVGGVDAGSIGQFAQVGVGSFGVGSCLYKPGRSADNVFAEANRLVEAFDVAVVK